MKRIPSILLVAAFAALSFSAAADESKKASCCARKAGAAKTAQAHDCDADKAAGKTAAMCDHATKTAVTLKGRLSFVKGSEAAAFQAEGRPGALEICAESKDLASLKAEGDGASLEVKGHLCKSKDGKEMLTVTSFRKSDKTAS